LLKIAEPIWCGNICDLDAARHSICLVDSIHNFAVTHHRDFVAKYLKAWLQLADQELSREPSYDGIGSNFDRSQPRLCRRPPKPEWKTLLDVSISREARRLNKLKRRKLKRRPEDEKGSLVWDQPNENEVGMTQFDVTEQIDCQIARRRQALNGFKGQLGDIVNSSIYRYKQVVFTEQEDLADLRSDEG